MPDLPRGKALLRSLRLNGAGILLGAIPARMLKCAGRSGQGHPCSPGAGLCMRRDAVLQLVGGLIQGPHRGGILEPSWEFLGNQPAASGEPGDVQPEAFHQGDFEKGEKTTKMLCLCVLLAGMVPAAQLLLLFFISPVPKRGLCPALTPPAPPPSTEIWIQTRRR